MLLRFATSTVLPSSTLLRCAPAKRNFLTVIDQYMKGVTLTLGKLTAVKEPGLRINIPLFQYMYHVDMRLHTESMSKQEVTTKDNISVQFDAVVCYRVVDAEKAVLSIDNRDLAVTELAKSYIREQISSSTLDETLHNRDNLASRTHRALNERVRQWGIMVEEIRLKDIRPDDQMVRALAKIPEAERQRQASIIHAEAQLETAKKLAEASDILAKNPVAMQLKYLDTILTVAKEKNNTSFLFPVQLLDFVQSLQSSKK